MSFKCRIEIAINLDSFRNIDLFHSGLYRLKICIYQDLNGRKIYANPYSITDCLKAKLREDSHVFKEADMNAEDCTCLSKTLKIKYLEKTYYLNDILHFRLEVPAFPNLILDNIYLECELMHAEFSMMKKPSQEETSFKTTSQFKCRLNAVALGINEYVPFQYDENHYCYVNATFHFIILDFRYLSVISPLENGHQGNLLPYKKFEDFIEKEFGEVNLIEFYNFYIQRIRDHYDFLAKQFSKYYLYYAPDHLKKSKDLYSFNKPVNELPPSAYMAKRQKDAAAKESLKENILQFLNLGDKNKGNQKVAEVLQEEINECSGFMYELWNRLMELLKFSSSTMIEELRKEYHSKMGDIWGESIFRYLRKTEDLASPFEENEGQNHKKIANQLRKQITMKKLEPLNIEDLSLFPKPEHHPILFEEITLKQLPIDSSNQNKAPQYEFDKVQDVIQGIPKNIDRSRIHLFVFVHGFRGNQFDLRSFKNNLLFIYEEVHYLCSSANEESTDGDIWKMGKNLANEVKTHINEYYSSKYRLGRISFIAHSLGGLIVRAALPHLKEHSDKLYTYISLSTPHIGYMYNSKTHIEAGMWIINKWTKSQCLQQLSMTDHKDVEETVIYKLSKVQGLGWFRNIVLCSSFQDQYVPYESARIQKPKKALDSEKEKWFIEMAGNLLSDIQATRVHRLDVNFNIPEINFDTMIGRAAHIKFLDSQCLMQMLVYCFDYLFK